MRAVLTPILATGLTLVATQAFASSVTLTFGNGRNQVQIGDYFNGGNDGYPRDGVGPNDGVVFSSNADFLKSPAAAGTGKFENNPSGSSAVAYFPYSTSTASYLNVASGFNSIDLTYSLSSNSAQYASTVDLWSGLNGTGTLLGTLSLTANPTTTACVNSRNLYCTWSVASANSFGTAESATFGDNTTTPFTELDKVSLNEVPIPGALLLFGSGLLGFAGLGRRRAGG
jgi:hypothetical protein